MDKKYLCIGGYVFSGDGDKHLISPYKLPNLFGVPKEKCVFVSHGADMNSFKGHGLIELRPSSSGNYNIEQLRKDQE